jgi:multisubunit Na+/H+ antiporter MnhB subunit
MAFLPAYSVAALLIRVAAAYYAFAVYAGFAFFRVAAGAVTTFFVDVTYPISAGTALLSSPVIALAITAVLVRVFAALPAAAIHAAQTLTLPIAPATAAE